MNNITSYATSKFNDSTEQASAYLFVYFTGNNPEEEQLFYGFSRNGYDFRTLNNGKPVMTSSLGTGCIRDPFIFRGEDGYYYIMATDMQCTLGWSSNHAIVIYKTSDFVNFIDSVQIDYHKFTSTSVCERAWAPQAIWCPEKSSYMIYLTIQNPNDGLGTIMWRHYADDLMNIKTYTEPEIMLLVGDDEVATIDGDIIHDIFNDRYIMYYNGKNIAIASTLSGEFSRIDSLTGEKFEILPFYTEDGREMLVEGSNIFKIIDKDQWLIFADGTSFNGGCYAFIETTDFIHYYQHRAEEFSFDFVPRHGYVIPITETQLNRLFDTYGMVETDEYSTLEYSLDINTRIKKADISENMIGLFFEDINSAADGGIYSEMINNRSFEAYHAEGKGGGEKLSVLYPIPGFGWNTINDAQVDFLSVQPLNENNTTYLQLTALTGKAGIVNDCYGGFSVNSGDRFSVSFYARGDYSGTLILSIIDGETILGSTVINDFQTEFKQYQAVITATEGSECATVMLLMSEKGKLDMDMISVMSQNTYNGRDNGLRKDVIEALRDMHPGFLRFPGGCIVEGYDLENRYQWKHTIGPVEERKQNWNRWQVHNWGSGRYGYCQTYGIGFYEYFLLCEDLECEPLPVLNCGMACQFQSCELADLNVVTDVYVQDALDLIEFANGDITTQWGAKRAELGHPEPFYLKYLAIGNEQWEEEYFKRYELFADVICREYPDIMLITSSGPASAGDKFDKSWKWLEGKNNKFAYLVDEHYYMPPKWFYENTGRYDNYDRKRQAVIAGEYAAHIRGSNNNNLAAALSEAAFLTGLIRNSDVVKMASYAPMLTKIGRMQWKPDLLWFDQDTVYGTPSYHVQALYAKNLGSYNLHNELSKDEGIYRAVSFDETTKDIIIMLVNPRCMNAKININIEGTNYIDSFAQESILTGNLSEVNSIIHPDKVSPKLRYIDYANRSFVYEIAPCSFVILRLHTKRDYAISTEIVKVQTAKGNKVLLPELVKVHAGNGSQQMLRVKWNTPKGNAFYYSGSYTIHGKVDGTGLYAKAEIAII